MSGSGGSVFMPVSNQQQGLEILAKRPSYSVGFVAKGLNIHPLLNLV
ncbi:MAG: 4-diphosphocytidyl-2-C-methyl-D-erythritol kinase [Arenicella sp.]|jgi:4-diphosphocytidyl-2-C-methyl-D-erythritol kinase